MRLLGVAVALLLMAVSVAQADEADRLAKCYTTNLDRGQKNKDCTAYRTGPDKGNAAIKDFEAASEHGRKSGRLLGCDL